MLWNKTIAPWLEAQGFKRGLNEPSVFWHPERELALLLYVDGILADGNEEDIDWIFKALGDRFETKEEEVLKPGTVIDYLGLLLIRDDQGRIAMFMSTYIENACKILNVNGNGRTVSTPIAAPIDTDSEPLDPREKKLFLTGNGMLGWLAQTVRCDVAYTYSRIAQHCAKPNKSALNAVYRAFRYLYQTRHLALCAPFDLPLLYQDLAGWQLGAHSAI